MGSISLRCLRLFNFRSFKGEHEIVFPESGLVILRGKSGHGKTNILLAIAYIFGFCRYSAKALQCWHDDEPMYVEAELSTPEGPVVVRRGIKGLSLNACVAEPGLKLRWLKGKVAETKLDQLCGVPTELREILTYRDQVKPKKLLAMRDGALKSFLFQVLNLTAYEDKIGEAEKKLAAIAEERERKNILAWNTKQEYDRRCDEIGDFKPESTDEAEGELKRAEFALGRMRISHQIQAREIETAVAEEQKAVEAIKGAAAQAEFSLTERLKQLQGVTGPEPDSSGLTKLRLQLEQCDGFIRLVTSADNAKRQTWDQETEMLRARARKLHNELARVPGLVDDTTRLMAEIDRLKADLCDRCGRQWDNAKVALDEHQRQLDEKMAALDAARLHKTEATQLDENLASRRFESDPRLDKLKNVRATLQAQIAAEETRLRHEAEALGADRRRAINELTSQLALVRAQGRMNASAYLQDPQRESTVLRAQQSALEHAITDAEKRVLTLDSQLALIIQRNSQGQIAHQVNVARMTEAEKRWHEARIDFEDAEKRWNEQDDYVAMLKGFRNKIFDEVLEAIGSDASALIATLPNVDHVTIEYRSERETQKNTIQEKITPVTYLDGQERVLEESVSGGQLTSISLAVDLAVAGVISRRLGCNLNWIILDESFEGHDVPTKLACLEMLQTYARDKLVIIVDHMSEFKEMFSKEISVVFENKMSRIA